MRLFIVLGLLLTVQFGFCAEDYRSRYEKLKQVPNIEPEKMESFLAEWREKQPENPDALIASANYYFNQASSPTISTKPAEKNDFVIADPKTKKPVGSMSFQPNKVLMSKSVSFLREALKKFPQRIDIWCGLAYTFQEGGDFDEEFAALKEMIAYSKSNSSALQWLKGAPLPEPADNFIPQKLHSYSLYYYGKQTEKDEQRFLKIAFLSAENYPHHSYAFNDVGAYYAEKGDQIKEREWLEKANKADPSDTLVLLNLGDVCVKLNDKAKAREYYQHVIDLKATAEDMRAAKEALANLDATK